jgi:hypothetical protein
VTPVKPVRRTKKVIAAEVAADAREGVFGELTSLVGSYSHIGMFTNSSNSQHWADVVAEAGPLAAAGVPADGAASTAAGGSAGAEISQQQGAGVGQLTQSQNGSRALCRTSGLGSFRQQVWLHSVPSDGGFILPSSTQEEQQQNSEEAKQDDVGAAEAAAVTAAAVANGLTGGKGDDAAAAAAAAAGGDCSSRAAELKLLPNLGYACLCMTMVSSRSMLEPCLLCLSVVLHGS